MGLNSRGRGRGRGNKANFHFKSRRGNGLISQGPIFRPGPPGVFCPPVGFLPEPSFGGPPFFGEHSGFTYGPVRPSFGKFYRKNFKKKILPSSNNGSVPDIDLTKPWVNEDIKNEENKREELLQIWRKTKTEEDWRKYKEQKFNAQSLYERAKAEYAAGHPEEDKSVKENKAEGDKKNGST